MNKGIKLVLGVAAAGVLLFGLTAGDVAARTVGWLYGRTLRVASTEGRDGTVINTLGDGDAYIQGDLEVAGQNYMVVPATETISAAGTITANACGGLKRITSSGDVTTGTTNTFTAPASTNKGCKMLVVNVGSGTIYLDSNALFSVTTAASIPLGPKGSVNVVSDGSVWLHDSWTEY
jgi:hypothetical protein